MRNLSASKTSEDFATVVHAETWPFEDSPCLCRKWAGEDDFMRHFPILNDRSARVHFRAKDTGRYGPASVQLRLGGNTVSFSNGTWNTTYSDIVIFDSVFIHDNVYAGDYVDHDHKKNLYRVIVGTQGVQLAKQIEDLDGKIRKANTDINTKKDAVSRTVSHRVTIDAYLAWQPLKISTTRFNRSPPRFQPSNGLWTR